MNDNVIRPPKFQRNSQEQREKHQQDLYARDIKRLREIEQQIEDSEEKSGKGPVFKRTEDLWIAARENGRLMELARQEKSVGEIKDGIEGKEKVGVSRIDRYMLDPKTTFDDSQAMSRLMQKVRGYLNLAQYLAKIIGTNQDQAKIDVLRETNFWSSWSRQPKSKDHSSEERAENLALLLNEMARYVIRESGLAELFGRARQIPGRWDAEDAVFRRVGMSQNSCLFTVACEDWFEHWEEAPPLPSVPLSRFLHATFDVEMEIEASGPEQPRRDETRFSEDFTGDRRNAQIRQYREIWLCLGPTTSPDRLGAMFESRANLEVVLQNDSEAQPHRVDPPWDLSLFEGACSQVLVNGTWRRARSLARIYPDTPTNDDSHDPVYWEYTPLSAVRSNFETYYFSWTPVRPDYVSHWLDRLVRFPDVVSLCPDDGTRSCPTDTWYRPHVLAHAIEVALAIGALEQALLRAIDAMRKSLAECEQKWREGLEASYATLFQHWNSETGE